MAACQFLAVFLFSIQKLLQDFDTLIILQTLDILDHGTSPLFLDHQPQSLDWIKCAAVRRYESLSHSRLAVVEEILGLLAVVNAVVVHVDNCLSFDFAN